MPLTKEQKERIVSDATDRLKKASVVVFTNFHGLDIPSITTLRRTLRSSGVDYIVIKKTLLDRALEKAGYEGERKLMGEVGIAIGYDDPIVVPRDTYAFAKSHEDTFKLLGGIFEKQEVGAREIQTIAAIPSREALLAQFLQVLNGPISGFVRTLNGVQQKFVIVLSEISKQRS